MNPRLLELLVKENLLTAEQSLRATAEQRRTNERLAWYLAFYEVEGVGRGYPERYRRQVEAVTAADVQRVARTYLGTLSSVVLGP